MSTATTRTSTHDYADDLGSDAILIDVNGVLAPRAPTTVAGFGCGFILDVWP